MKTNAGKAQQAYLSALGTRVREARAKRGMSRRILAHDSGVSERYLALLESGGANPSIDHRDRPARQRSGPCRVGPDGTW